MGDVHTRPGRLSHGCQRLLEGCPFAGVGDVDSRLAVEIIRLGLHLEDAPPVFDGGYRHPQPVGRYGDGAVERRIAGDHLAVDAYRFQQPESDCRAHAHNLCLRDAGPDGRSRIHRKTARGRQKPDVALPCGVDPRIEGRSPDVALADGTHDAETSRGLRGVGLA